MQPNPDTRPVINCHTHIFTAEHVPPFLAKTFVPWPLYYVLHLPCIVALFRFYYNKVQPFFHKPFYKRFQDAITTITWLFNRVRVLKDVLGYFISLQVLFIVFDWLSKLIAPEAKIAATIQKIHDWASGHYLLVPLHHTMTRVLLFLLVWWFVPSGRNLILFVLKKAWSFLAMLPGKQTTELLKRYVTMARYAFHREQQINLQQLRDQYPPGSGFVILPMDMEYMAAGNVRCAYEDQMETLSKLKASPNFKEIMFPFVFADPRRIKEDRHYFDYEVVYNEVILNNCFVKRFIEKEEFRGFKIYPALGYYPFDEYLLPLFKYAADNELPITTHCIRGTIFYRGPKKWEWNHHPVFEQAIGNKEYKPLLLAETDNVDFQEIFTHPLNYLCLLNECLLRKLVGASKQQQVKQLFGYTDSDTPLKTDLSKLKICFGHYGGDDEWLRYFETERMGYGAQLMKHPSTGIEFLMDAEGNPSLGKCEQIWKNTDWYSIISSLMLQYENVYADISYILHSKEAIYSLLEQTLQHPVLREKILYGTDFYVVRNHKSDRNMLADMQGGLSTDDFNQIAKTNPRHFLANTLHGPVAI